MEQIWAIKKDLKKQLTKLKSLFESNITLHLEIIVDHCYLVEKFAISRQKKKFSLILQKIHQESTQSPINEEEIEVSLRKAYSLIVQSIVSQKEFPECMDFINTSQDFWKTLPYILNQLLFNNFLSQTWNYETFFKYCKNSLNIESNSKPLFFYILDKIKKFEVNPANNFFNSKYIPLFFSYLYGNSKRCKKFYYLNKFLCISRPSQSLSLNIEVYNKSAKEMMNKSYFAEFKSAVLTLGNSDEFDININEFFNTNKQFSCLLFAKNNMLAVLNFSSKNEIFVKLLPNVAYLIHKGDTFKFGNFYIKVLSIKYFIERQLKSFIQLELRENKNVMKTFTVEKEKFVFGISTGDYVADEIMPLKNGVSKTHFFLSFHDGRWFIQDSNSKNGTYYLAHSVKNLHFSSPFELVAGRVTLIQLAISNFIIKLSIQ